MNFVDKLLNRRKPTASILGDELAKAEKALESAPDRIERAEWVLQQIAVLDDEEHAAAEIELEAAKREQKRLAARVEVFRKSLAVARKVEAAAALQARAVAAQRSVDQDAPALLKEYEQAAAHVAKIAGQLLAIDHEVQIVNDAIRRAPIDNAAEVRPERVLSISERFLREPDDVEPDKVVTYDVWQVPAADGGGWQDATVFCERNGKTVPESPAARVVQRRYTVPGRTRKGRIYPSPVAHLVLPSARFDAHPFWPRVQ